ncbi:MAG: tetratricopeptide repeat protein [Chitinivibrionales bacterium]|nr:tetratricopeptide repeat protein [Chitinivibrionales bacterium]
MRFHNRNRCLILTLLRTRSILRNRKRHHRLQAAKRKGFLIGMTLILEGKNFVRRAGIPALICMLLCIAEGSTSPLDSAARLMELGAYDKAAGLVDAAYKENPDDPEIILAYALFQKEADKAESYFKILAADSDAAEPVRVEALYRLGSLYYMRNDYEKATRYFEDAYKLVNDPSLISMVERCEKASGATSEGSFPTKAGAYVLQVGSYSSIENAQKRKAELEKYFDILSIEKAVIKNREFFRVRIGEFLSREEAESYAKKNLVPRDIGYKALQQQQ